MNLQTTVHIYGYGTSEGVEKAWDTRGRGRHHSAAKDIAVDFDGTVAEHVTGSKEIGEPMVHGLELLNTLKQHGYNVMIHTARKGEALQKIQQWLIDHGVGFATATNSKPNAAAYIDNRAVHWTGNDSVDEAMKQVDTMSKERLQEEQESAAKGLAVFSAMLLYGGGEGSGCRGPNCGRPSEQSHGALKMPRGRQTAQRIDRELQDAAAQRKVVLMEYKSDSADPDQKAKSYLVEPYSYRNEGKIFFAFDQTAKSIKGFKFDNIVRVSPIGKTFKPRWPVELGRKKDEPASDN